eukprot:722734-Rhodomonas_salina.3
MLPSRAEKVVVQIMILLWRDDFDNDHDRNKQAAFFHLDGMIDRCRPSRWTETMRMDTSIWVKLRIS